MSRADSAKAYIYYYCRRGWYNEIVAYCDGIMARKGKEPTAIFWKAFGLGMSQGLERARQELEVFHNRRDLQLPVTVALLYFAKEERAQSSATITFPNDQVLQVEGVPGEGSE